MTKLLYRTAVVFFAVINFLFANGNNYESVSIGNYNIEFSPSGDIYSLHISYPQKNTPPKTAHLCGVKGKPLIEITFSDNAFIDSCMRTARVTFSKSENDSTVIVSFRSNILENATYFEKTFTFKKKSYLSNISIKYSGDYAQNIQNSPTLIVNGSDNDFDKYHYISINKNKVLNIKPDTKDTLTNFMWGGKRNRFWTMLFTTETRASAHFDKNQLSINLKADYKDEYSIGM